MNSKFFFLLFLFITFLTFPVAAQKDGKTFKVVIDAGHGGKDPGCLGAYNKEKDVVLNIALKTGKLISDNFEYIHVNYNPRKSENAEKAAQAAALMTRLDNCGRFGVPVFVVLDDAGKVIHIQDSSFLEEGQGYNKEKVLRFFKNWTPQAVKNNKK